MIEERKAFNFTVSKDSVLALITAFLMPPVYYANTHYGMESSAVFFIVFILLGHLLLNTLIPAYVVLHLSGEGLSGLGITTNNLIKSIVISIVLAAISYYQLLIVAQEYGDVDLLPHLIFNGLLLWEVLFVYGWLQLRFEKAFGYILAPILSALCFCLYHVGSFDSAEILPLFFSGLIFGIVFGITRNIFSLIPIAWSVSSGIGTITGGFIGGWDHVFIYSLVVVVQIFILWKINTSSHNTTKGA